jgi:hypothetical protein
VGSPRSTKDPKGDGTLKFMAFYEYEPEDIDKVLEKGVEAAAIRQRDPERFPTVLFDFNIVGETKGVAVFETDNPDQLCNIALHNVPEVTCTFVPIQEAARGAELYQKMKQ